jgi:hypothetical protein
MRILEDVHTVVVIQEAKVTGLSVKQQHSGKQQKRENKPALLNGIK